MPTGCQLNLVTMGEVVFRAAVADDARLVEEMLVEAVNAPSGTLGRSEALADPAIARYVDDWPRETDIGVVAIDRSDERVGAAWLRFFTEAAPGYGFVRADIPELAIGVAADHRGKGVGRALLRALADTARASGVEHICLSVERANPAVSLYRAEGYRVVDTRETAHTMVLTLR